MTDREVPNPVRTTEGSRRPQRDAAAHFRRRLRAAAVALVLSWATAAAVIAGVASGRWGDLGLPTNAEGQPRGLLLIGLTTALAAAATAGAYARVSAQVGDLLRAAEQVAVGDYGAVDVRIRGPRELRLLTSTFNQMAAKLATDEIQRRRFLADITHELRSPLAVLRSEIEAQIDGVHQPDEKALSSLLEETLRLGLLVEDLHTLALRETGRLVLRPVAVALDDVVEEAVGHSEVLARRRGVALRTSRPPELPKAWADPGRVRQVLDNLLANAVRHSPAGGEVLVALGSVRGADPPMLVCRVTDAGPGFREDQVDRVFERFERASDSGGSGLGLSIARDLVSAHGGEIHARNDTVTGGATVGFTLPTAAPLSRPDLPDPYELT